MEIIWKKLSSLFDSNTDLLGAAIVAALVSAAVSYFFRKIEIRDKLKAEYEYEQRKKLRNLIGEFHGRMINATNSLNYRLWNHYSNYHEGWLNVEGDYSPENHYFHSCVHRFLAVSALTRQFEKKAIYVDGRIAEKGDFLFLRYVAVLHWCMTDVALFEGLEYDKEYETDHFFSDNFRKYCDLCIQKEDTIIEFDNLSSLVQDDRSLDAVLEFFDGLSPEEDRYRWDRMVAFHLLLIGFINNFGYEEQKTSKKKIQIVASKIKHPEVLRNIINWLPRHGLVDKKGGKLILSACNAELSPKKSLKEQYR